jgi:hypothetical protein
VTLVEAGNVPWKGTGDFFASVHRTAAGSAIGVRKSDMDRRDAKRLAAAARLVIPLCGCVADQKKRSPRANTPSLANLAKSKHCWREKWKLA